jgi:predicted DNA-binding transcriptional regulator YafY
MKRLKPYLLHRFAPGMYAIDRARRDELEALLQEAGFAPSHETRTYPGTAEAVEARASLHRALAEAREAVQDPMTRTLGTIAASLLAPVPGARQDDGGKAAEPDQPPMVDATQARVLVDRALTKDAVLEMVYLAKNGQRIACEVQPQRLAIKDGSPVLVGLDMNDNERRTYVLDRIERLRLQGAADA